MVDLNEDEVAELTTFQCREAYVYAPLPPAPHWGHRAELWDVDKWLREVKVRVVTRQDDCFVRMEDQETGELFAECPLPNDGTSLTTAVEPVVDSSRYFVVKVVDREDHKKHAFVGLGFRERNAASDFTAALDDFRQLVRRTREAEEMRQKFQGLSASRAAEGAAAAGSAEAAEDLRLKETITLTLSKSIKRNESGEESQKLLTRLSGSFGASTFLGVVPSPAGGVKLQPPPPPGQVARTRQQLPSSPGVSLGGSGSQAAFTAGAMAAPSVVAATPAAGAAEATASVGSGSGQPQADQEEDWADFQS